MDNRAGAPEGDTDVFRQTVRYFRCRFTEAPLTNTDPQDVAAKIAELEELSRFLYELAIDRPEFVDMLFRLSDNAGAEAEKLKRHFAAAI